MTGTSMKCSRCNRYLNLDPLIARCPFCGGLPIITYENPRFKPDPSMPGIWRYSSLLPAFNTRISRGEGLTPIWRVGGVYIKYERFNPTGSYADRASALITSYIAQSGFKRVIVRYEEDFSRSMIYYLASLNTLKPILCVDNPLEVRLEDLLELLKIGEITVCSGSTEAPIVEYMNPLTVEGLKTIVFELYERRLDFDYIVIPAKSGILAFSLAKGVKDLEEAGVSINYEVVVAIRRGEPIPEIIRGEKHVKLFEVEDVDIIRSLRELSEKRVYTTPLSAMGYHVARQLGRSVAVITMGFKSVTGRRGGELRDVIIRTLERLGKATAYEIWRENQGYSLRGVYRAIRGVVEENVVLRGDYS